MIAQEQEIAKPYILASEGEKKREKHMAIYTNLGGEMLLLGLFRKGVWKINLENSPFKK